MQETTNQAKPTPTRRRHGRNGGGKAAGQKMYASENDMANVSSLGGEQSDHPRTPHKSHCGSPEPRSAAGIPNSSKQRSRNKVQAKPQNTANSPNIGRQNRRSTPQNIPVAKTSSATAFAGATFHASPAPSALPMPSYYSKAVPESPGNQTATRQDMKPQPSPPAANYEVPTPHHPSTTPQARESPLDAIFRADRAEKEEARRASFLYSSSQTQGLVSPSVLSPKDDSGLFTAKPHNTHPGHRMPARRSPSGISSAELDGVPGKSLGPAFSTPYQERIRAARAPPNQPSIMPKASQSTSEDRSEALKKYLFGGKDPEASPRSTPHGPSAGYASNGMVENEQQAGEARSADLRAMENNLRRILKLDSPLAATKSERTLYS